MTQDGFDQHTGSGGRPRRPPRLTAPEIIAAIRRWHAIYGEPPTMADWDPHRARKLGQDWRVERYRRDEWPSAKTVRNHFGRLSDAIAAAGLVPRHQGQQRPREELSLDLDTLLQVVCAAALEHSRQGLRINAVCPGIVDTPLLRRFVDAADDPDAIYSAMEQLTPTGRMVSAEEVASC